MKKNTLLKYILIINLLVILPAIFLFVFSQNKLFGFLLLGSQLAVVFASAFYFFKEKTGYLKSLLIPASVAMFESVIGTAALYIFSVSDYYVGRTDFIITGVALLVASVVINGIIFSFIHKMKKFWLVTVLTLIFVAIFVYFLPNILGLFYRDIGPIDDSDLQLKTVFVPDSGNSYFDLIKLDENIYMPEDKDDIISDIVVGKIWDQSIVNDILSKNAEALENISVAAKKFSFQNPLFADPENFSYFSDFGFISGNTLDDFISLSKIYVLSLLRKEKGREAVEAALNMVKIGQSIQNSQAPIIEYIMASKMKTEGLKMIQTVIGSAKLSKTELASYGQELNQFYKNRAGLATAMKVEYRMQSQAIDLMVSGGKAQADSLISDAGVPFSDFYFQPNKTKAEFAEQARYVINNLNKPADAISGYDYGKIIVPSGFSNYVTVNFVGKKIVETATLVILSSSFARLEEENSVIKATQDMLVETSGINYSISKEQAIDIIKNLPEVKEWLSDYIGADNHYINATACKAHIVVAGESEGEYSIVAYEACDSVDGGDTSNYKFYDVDAKTGKVSKKDNYE